MGGRLLRQWLVRPLVDARADSGSARRRRGLRVPDDRARQAARGCSKAIHDLERLVARISLGTAGPRDLRVARPVARRSCRGCARSRPVCRRRSSRSLVAEVDDLADVRDAIATHVVDEPPAVARDGGVIRDGVDAELDELRADQPRRQGRDCGDGRGRARAHRHRVAQDPLQPRLRLLHRGLEVEPRRACRPTTSASRRSPAASASSRRRSRSTKTRCSAPTSASPCASSSSSRRSARAIAAEAPRILDTARAVATLDVLAALADAAAAGNYTKPLIHDGDEFSATDARHPVVERHVAGAFVPNDVHLDGAAPAARDPHRAEHGRQVDLPAAGRAARAARAGRLVRAGAAAPSSRRRSHLRARRRLRQHRARPVDVHGRDAGDGDHPAHGDDRAAW